MTESELIALTNGANNQSIMDSLTMPGFWLVTILVLIIISLAIFSYLALRDYQALRSENDVLLDIAQGMESDLAAVTEQLKRVRLGIDLLEDEYNQYRISSDNVIDKLVEQASII